MSRTLSLSHHLGEAGTPVDVSFKATWDSSGEYGDPGYWTIDEITITDPDGKDLTEMATAEELIAITEKASKVADDECDPTPEE